MTLKIAQGHWWWQFNRSHITLCSKRVYNTICSSVRTL